jgi:hypothetical protein
MIVRRDARGGPIGWECSSCRDAGLISGWENSPQDLTDPGPTPTTSLNQIHIHIPDEVAAALRDLRLLDVMSERVIYRMRAYGDDLVLTATDGELEELIGAVAAEANHEPNRRRRQRLDVAIDTLGNAAQNPRRPLTMALGTVGSERGDASRTTKGLPELDIARVQRWCADRVPEHARHEVRVECEVAARHLTIVERRAPWRTDFGPDWTSFPIARLRYAKGTTEWTLCWRDRNLRFHTYDQKPPTPHIVELLIEIDSDPTAIFWG